MDHRAILRPRIFEPFGWLCAGMTTRSASSPAESRETMATRLRDGLPQARIVLAGQVHGCGVARADQDPPPRDKVREIPGVDALATASPLVLIGVFTADCLPVALVDPRRRNLAVAHAGREGTRQGIVRKTVECLREMGSAPRDMVAWVGPSICAAHYEVSEEIAAQFRERFGHNAGLVAGPEGRHLDLREINRRELTECGVDPSRIEVDPRCTLEDADLFYSYRREGASAGRMLTFLGIRDAE